MEIFNNANLTFLPIIIFAVILVIGGIIGFITGWRTALYFLIWNIFAIYLTIVITATLWSQITGLIPNVHGIDISKISLVNRETVEPALGVILVLALIIVFNIFGFMIYWVFRSKLKRIIFRNKARNISNTPGRLIGSGVGVIAAIPMSIFATSASSVFFAGTDYKNTKFAQFSDKLIKATSLGRWENTTDNISEIYHLANSAKNIDDVKDVIEQIFGATSDNTTNPVQPDVFNDAKKKSTIEAILNSKMLNKSTIEAALPDDLKPDPNNPTDFKQLTDDFDPANKFTTPIHIDDIAKVSKIVADSFGIEGTDPDDVTKYFVTMGLIKIG